MQGFLHQRTIWPVARSEVRRPRREFFMRFRRCCSFALLPLLALVALLSTGGLADAQTDRATLEGTVTDASGAIISGAKVKIFAVATAQSQERITNSAGHYRFPGVAVGLYTIEVSRNGF